MLSTEYRLKLQFICTRISNNEEVKLEDMIWADKLAKANRSAGEMLRKARREATAAEMPKDSLDDFLNQMNLGDPDPTQHIASFDGADEIVEFFKQEKPEDWRQHD